MSRVLICVVLPPPDVSLPHGVLKLSMVTCCGVPKVRLEPCIRKAPTVLYGQAGPEKLPLLVPVMYTAQPEALTRMRTCATMVALEPTAPIVEEPMLQVLLVSPPGKPEVPPSTNQSPEALMSIDPNRYPPPGTGGKPIWKMTPSEA